MEYMLHNCSCGSEASISYYGDKFIVYCDDEFCGNCSGIFPTKYEAVKAWNNGEWSDCEPYDAPNE